MWIFVAFRMVGVAEVNSTPPFSRWAASVRIITTTKAANNQSIAKVMNGSSNT